MFKAALLRDHSITVSGTAAVRIPASRNLLLEFIKTV
jgi:hypothetical protein